MQMFMHLSLYSVISFRIHCYSSCQWSSVSSWWRKHGDFKNVQVLWTCPTMSFPRGTTNVKMKCCVNCWCDISVRRDTPTVPFLMFKSFLRTWEEDNRVVVILCSSCVSLDTTGGYQRFFGFSFNPSLTRLFHGSCILWTSPFGGEDGLQWYLDTTRKETLYAICWKSAIWESSLVQDISWWTYKQWTSYSRNWTRFIDFMLYLYVNKGNTYITNTVYLFVKGYLDCKRQLYFLKWMYFSENVV